MDRERANTDYCHVTEDGLLVNGPPENPCQKRRRRFRHYFGTCTTSPIPLHILPSSPTSLLPLTYHYWETETSVTVNMKLERRGSPLMEVGIVEENHLDSDLSNIDEHRRWCLRVANCYKHPGYCVQVWNKESRVKCVQHVLHNAPGTSRTFRYGVAVDVVRGKVGFVDTDRGIVVEKMNARFGESLYPVFGVWPYRYQVSVQMKLFEEGDIAMSEDKLKTILSCLS